jgi:hypothetical protein
MQKALQNGNKSHYSSRMRNFWGLGHCKDFWECSCTASDWMCRIQLLQGMNHSYPVKAKSTTPRSPYVKTKICMEWKVSSAYQWAKHAQARKSKDEMVRLQQWLREVIYLLASLHKDKHNVATFCLSPGHQGFQSYCIKV